jgi:hypothetical protein
MKHIIIRQQRLGDGVGPVAGIGVKEISDFVHGAGGDMLVEIVVSEEGPQERYGCPDIDIF